ncbi:MAG: M1 family metallopeptidase [Piscinibacter sp.]|nr:M1 family metallopeptidase [Piscinibacter sp.]
MALCATLVAPFMAGLAQTAVAQERFRFDATPGRLSKDVMPVRYRLAFEVDPERDTFDGHAEIELRVRRPADAIELHAHELQAASARLMSGPRRRELTVTPDADAQTWRLTPNDGAPIAAGTHRVAIDYAGKVQRQGEGLYRAVATIDGQQQASLATQLEPIHARRLFPAFDEPAFRARFDVTVRAPARYAVLANMPRMRHQTRDAITEHAFASTPPMPSYLLALAVGHFDTLDGRAAGVPLRIVTAPGKREQGRYALDVTRQLLPFYRDYFGTPYALPRLDQLAVPSTRWGAMEDWGLISYAEDTLLIDPAHTNPTQQRSVYWVIAHEVSHQWFGNLVTAASWNEIWLNEAFATWMANKAMDRFNPAWQVRLNLHEYVDETMATDATDATRAIRSGPVRETAVSDVFDDITYVKGGAVLGMIEQWLGEERFRQGLAAYMHERRLSNATAGDLWFHIGRAAGRDVASMAASWTDQPGFPIVAVRSRCDGDVTRVTLTQQRFRAAAMPAVTGGPWQIPVRLARGEDSKTVLLTGAETSSTLPGCSDVPVLANAGGRGYYRVAYAPDVRSALRARLATLPAADRVVLLSDTLALAQAGELPLAEALRWLGDAGTVRDAGRVPLFKQSVEAYEWLDTALRGTPQQAPLRESAYALLKPELARLGWDPSPADDAETLAMRARLVRALGRLEDPDTRGEALRRVERHDAGTQRLHPSMVEAAQIVAGAVAGRARFDRMLARLEKAEGEQERHTVAKALASSNDPARATELLDRMLKGDLPANIAMSMPARVAELSPLGDLAYRHLVDHWSAWSQLAGAVGARWLLPGAAGSSNDPARAAQLRADQQRLVGPDGQALAERAAARIGQQAAVKERAATIGP